MAAIKKGRPGIRVTGVWALFLLCSGCAMVPPAGTRPLSPGAMEALSLMDALKQKNTDLKTLKGLGSLRLKRDGEFQRLRAAWMGESPEKLRVEALALSGQPMASLSGDGRWVYFLSHTDGRYYKKPYGEGFERFLSIPMDPGQLLALLGGKISTVKHDAVNLEKDPDSTGYVLILKKRWHGVVQKLFLDPQKKKVYKIEWYNGRGDLSFRVFRDRFQAVSGFEIPFFIHAADDAGSFFELTVQRCWINVPTDPGAFVIAPRTG